MVNRYNVHSICLSLAWVLIFEVQGQWQLGCTRGFASLMPNKKNARINDTDLSQPQTILIPDMNFACGGTIVRMAMTVVAAKGQPLGNNWKLCLQIWRENDELFRQEGRDIVLNSSVCRRRNQGSEPSSDARVFRCTDQVQRRVEHGDVLGIRVLGKDNDFPLYFIHSGITNYIFLGQNPVMVNLSDSNSYTQISQQPLLTLKVELVQDSQPPSVTQHTTTPGNSRTTTQAVAASVAVVFMVLLVVIIILIVVGFFLLNRRSKRQGQPHNNYPNLLYYNNQGDVIQSTSYKVDSAGDYDVIQDELCIEQSCDQYMSDSAAMDSTKSSNYYYSLTQKQPQEETSTSHSMNPAANYEVCAPTDDGEETLPGVPQGSCEKDKNNTFEPTSEVNDEDDTYWEPADSINELYKQLSSKKYREIAAHQVKLVGVLGAGEFGTVSSGIWQSPVGDMEVAVKQLRPGTSEEEKVKFLQEAAINGQFRHPNVVNLMGVVTTEEPTMIVLELLSSGDLMSFLRKQQPHDQINSVDFPKPCMNQKILLRFCQQVASGMEYLSNKTFVHRDLAARNILVSEDLICKISDFGMSRNISDENYYVSRGGKIPVKWTAPEAIQYRKYSTASDVWSFTCVMYEIWSLGHKPFESYTNPEVVKMVDKGCRPPPPPGLSKELYKIMIQCWQPDSCDRPTFSQLVEMLSRADFELFVWEEQDLRDSDPQVKVIGAPLQVAQNLYPELQNMYK